MKFTLNLFCVLIFSEKSDAGIRNLNPPYGAHSLLTKSFCSLTCLQIDFIIRKLSW